MARGDDHVLVLLAGGVLLAGYLVARSRGPRVDAGGAGGLGGVDPSSRASVVSAAASSACIAAAMAAGMPASVAAVACAAGVGALASRMASPGRKLRGIADPGDEECIGCRGRRR